MVVFLVVVDIVKDTDDPHNERTVHWGFAKYDLIESKDMAHRILVLVDVVVPIDPEWFDWLPLWQAMTWWVDWVRILLEPYSAISVCMYE